MVGQSVPRRVRPDESFKPVPRRGLALISGVGPLHKLPEDVTQMLRSIAALALLLPIVTAASAQERAPRVLVDKGACPFECCQYGRWTATKAIPAFTTPGAQRAAFTIPAGAVVTAMTGYVRTVGQPFVVARPHAPYKSGDTLMVYTYYGEGMFSVWHRGKRFTEDLGFSPYGGTAGKRCTDKERCWGTLSRELQSDWWVQVRLVNDKTVWVHGSNGFQGQDACGQ